MRTTLAALATMISEIRPEHGGYRMDDTDAWSADVDASRKHLRSFSCRLEISNGDVDTDEVTESLTIEYPVQSWAGTRVFAGLDPLYAKDVARLSATHLLSTLLDHYPTATDGTFSITPDENGAWQLVSCSITLHDEV